MTSVYYYQNTDLGNKRVRLGSIASISSAAERGVVSTSSIELDDPLGTLDLPPFFSFLWHENAASQPLVYLGYGSQRSYQRASQDGLIVGPQRRISLQVEDLNSQLTFRVVNHNTSGYKRPAEDDYHRIDWLLGGLLSTTAEHGLIDRDPTTNVSMSAVDYTGQTPDQVLQDCSDLSGKNYFLYLDPTTGERSLAYFKSTDASFFPSGLTISNDPTDIGVADTYVPLREAVLTRDPSQTYNGAMMDYSGGTIYLQYGTNLPLVRDVIIPSANTSSVPHAVALVNKYLAEAANERETVTCTIQMPAANINDLVAGMLVTGKFLQFDGWESGLDVRVLSRSISTEMSDQFYNVELTIGHPKLVSFALGQVPDNTRVWPSTNQPPFTPQPTITDTFNRPDDSVLGVADCGRTWVRAGGGGNSGAILNNQGLFTSTFGANNQHLPGPWPVDLHARADVIAATGNVQIGITAHGHAGATDMTFSAQYQDSSHGGGPSLLVQATDGSGTTSTSLGLTGDQPLPLVLDFRVDANGVYAIIGSQTATALYVNSTVHVLPSPTDMDGNLELYFEGNGTTTVDNLDVDGVPGLGGVPAIGQTAAPESATSDGSKVLYQSNYPYFAGSLVVKVNGNILSGVTETAPDAGVFTLPAAPASGAIITWTYSVADQTPTGVNNPPASSNPPGVPPDPGSFPGGDGTSRPPDQEYTPAETPDGSLTVFTIVPYVAGQAFVYINGLIERKGTDWNELSPAAGTFEFTSAPWTGASITVKAMPITAPPTGSGFGNPSLYGSGLNADTKANIQMGPEGDVALRFRCGDSSALDSILIQARGGPVYSGGTGGSYAVTVKAVDASGNPTGSALATKTYTPGNPGGSWTSYDTITWSSPATLVDGTLYAVQFHNADGSPLVNYVSINNLFVFGGTLNPRQPLFPDADMAVLVNLSSWLTRTQFTGNFDLTYASGHHDGQGYVQNMIANYGTVTGTTTMVRENFTVSDGNDRTVVSCAVRVRRSSGTDPLPLILGLYTSGDVLIEAVSIPPSLVPISAAGSDNGGSVWAGGRFLSPHILAGFSSYYLRLSCASSSTYTAAPIRKGTDDGFDGSLVFMDGTGQFTTDSGGTWTDLYTFDTDAPDLQFYFGVTT